MPGGGIIPTNSKSAHTQNMNVSGSQMGSCVVVSRVTGSLKDGPIKPDQNHRPTCVSL